LVKTAYERRVLNLRGEAAEQQRRQKVGGKDQSQLLSTGKKSRRGVASLVPTTIEVKRKKREAGRVDQTSRTDRILVSKTKEKAV